MNFEYYNTVRANLTKMPVFSTDKDGQFFRLNTKENSSIKHLKRQSEPLLRQAKLFNISPPVVTQNIADIGELNEDTEYIKQLVSRDFYKKNLPFECCWFEFVKAYGHIADQTVATVGLLITRMGFMGSYLWVCSKDMGDTDKSMLFIAVGSAETHETFRTEITDLGIHVGHLVNSINNEQLNRTTSTITDTKYKVRKGKMRKINIMKDVIGVDLTPGHRVVKKPEKSEPVEWSHCWEVRGHWRRIPEGSIGKDQAGERCVEGKTWVSESIKGDTSKPLINKVRAVKIEPSVPNKAS